MGVDFTAHIIGLDVPPEQTRGLCRVAEDTGGIFVEANNASDLNKAMATMRVLITEVDTKKRGKAIIQVPSEVPASSAIDAELTGPGNRTDYLVIRTPDREKDFSSVYSYVESYPSLAVLVAPDIPGSYVIRLITRGGEELARSDLQVEKLNMCDA